MLTSNQISVRFSNLDQSFFSGFTVGEEDSDCYFQDEAEASSEVRRERTPFSIYSTRTKEEACAGHFEWVTAHEEYLREKFRRFKY